jgi:SAM-dependent methyltransferase
VVAIEPSAEMVRQRSATAPSVIRASADRLPIRDLAFDASLAILTIHHWPDWRRGLAEMLRVGRDRVVLLTWDADHHGFWLLDDYFPDLLAIDRQIMPSLAAIESELGPLEVQTVPIPADCTDGFLGAYWRRPEKYLDNARRGAISTFSRLPDPEPGLTRLRQDLDSGSWAARYGWLRELPEINLGYRLVIARRESRPFAR